jgi:hypothetical protein
MLHAILLKEKLIGLYSDYTQCENMIQGLVNNNFSQKSHLKIKSYYTNSITCDIYDNQPIPIEDSDILLSNEKDDTVCPKLTKQKICHKSKLEYNINLLKQKKEKIEEQKRVYKNDYDIYIKFKKFKTDSSVFIVPELFQKKYELFNKLESENNLSWETFNTHYVKENLNTSYSNLFETGSNIVERKLLNISDTESEDD